MDTDVQVYPFEQPERINTLDPGNVTFRWTSSLDYLFQDDTVVFTKQSCPLTRDVSVRRYVSDFLN